LLNTASLVRSSAPAADSLVLKLGFARSQKNNYTARNQATLNFRATAEAVFSKV